MDAFAFRLWLSRKLYQIMPVALRDLLLKVSKGQIHRGESLSGVKGPLSSWSSCRNFLFSFWVCFETSKHITSPILILSLMSLSFLPKAGLAAAYAARDFKLPCTVAALAELFEGCYFWISFHVAITFGNIVWYGWNRSTCIRLVTVCSLEVGYVHWNVQPTLFEASVSFQIRHIFLHQKIQNSFKLFFVIGWSHWIAIV